MGKLRELFVFLAGSNKVNVFKEHLHYLVSNCKVSPAIFLGNLITEEGLLLGFFCFPHLMSVRNVACLFSGIRICFLLLF